MYYFPVTGNQQLALPLQLAADNLKLVMDKRQVGVPLFGLCICHCPSLVPLLPSCCNFLWCIISAWYQEMGMVCNLCLQVGMAGFTGSYHPLIYGLSPLLLVYINHFQSLFSELTTQWVRLNGGWVYRKEWINEWIVNNTKWKGSGLLV